MKSALHQTTTPVHTLPAIGTIHLIPVSMLHPMPCSPFKIREDDAMQELILSIRNFGILNPLEVRPNDSGKFEIISGARRYQGAIQNLLESIPAVIMDLDDDEAIIRMVDSNIQREYLLPFERAYAYKMRMEALKRKAGRPKTTASKNSPKISANFRSDDSIGEKAGISGDTVRNYISLTLLVPALMQLVDESKIALTPAYQLTHLSPAEQDLLFETIKSEQATPSLSQAQRTRRLSERGQLNKDTMLSIMMEQKKPVKRDVALSGDKLRKYFPKHYSPEQIETIIFKLLISLNRGKVIKYQIKGWAKTNTALDYNCPCQKDTGFFFLPVSKAVEIISTERCSEMDIILDLWISTVYSDPQVESSSIGPVVYIRNGTGSPLVSFNELSQRWGISKATVDRTLKT